MRKIALAFSFYLLVFSFAQAQENYLTLRGRVTDRDTREGLPAVTVYVAGQAIYTQTNNDGEYVLKVPAEHRDGSVVYALMDYLRDTVTIAKAQRKRHFFHTASSLSGQNHTKTGSTTEDYLILFYIKTV